VTLLIHTLGIFWAWSFVRQALPWEIPDVLKPALVYGMAFALVYPDWLFAGAIAGGVAVLTPVVLHFIPEGAPVQMPNLRRGAAGRIPPLP
jgi:hypothetical protein